MGDIMSKIDPGIIVIAHGSKDPKWCQSFENFMDGVRVSLGSGWIEAYMSLNSPTLKESASKLVTQGHETIIVVPFFMASGGHVDHDIPALVQEAQEAFPSVSFTLTPPIGEHPDIANAMLGVLRRLQTEPF